MEIQALRAETSLFVLLHQVRSSDLTDISAIIGDSIVNKEDYVLAVMSATKMNPLTPVRVQKLFFLLDDTIPEKVGGPYFEFVPYDFGPFDKTVYHVFKSLAIKNMAEIKKPDFNTPQMYQLTALGQEIGSETFESFPDDVQDYIVRLVEWILENSFTQIVSAMYKYYPDMKTGNVFGK